MAFTWPTSLQDWILISVSSIGIIWYYICIFYVGITPLPDSQQGTAFRQFMSLSITTISVSLATFVGMLLGFRSVTEEIQKGVVQANAMVGARADALPQLREVAQSINPNASQSVAAMSYILSLVIALFLWWRGGDKTDPAISKLGQSLLGLIGGTLSVILNTNR